jgi:hypothetical protein
MIFFKKSFCVFLFFVVAFCFFSFSINSEVSNNCNLEQACFKSGEVVSYNVYYNLGPIWVPAAFVSFTVEFVDYLKNPCFKFKGKGQTFPSYNWIFKVDDTYETYVDTNDFRPIKYTRDTKEGSTKIYSENYFNNKKNLAYSFTKKNSNNWVKDTVQISSCTFDVLTMIYAARRLNYNLYKVNDKIPISIYLDNKLYPKQYIKYLGKEVIKTELGEYNCIKFKPALIPGTIFKAGDEMIVWVSDDKNRIPLLVETPILVGSIKAKVQLIKNNKYPLSSLIKKI